MISDWENHLNKLDRRKRIFSKVSRVIAFIAIMCWGFWVLLPLVISKQEEQPTQKFTPRELPEYGYADAIHIVSDAGGITFTWSDNSGGIYFVKDGD